MAQKKLVLYPITINNTATNIIPCYFPIGRGNPKGAVEILKMLS